MWLRQAFFRWLLPAAFLLPLWLLIGWGVTGAGGWAFLLLLISMPAVFIGQLLLTLLVRSRPSVRVERAVSWWDVAGFTLWHGLTIAIGFFPQAWFGLLLTGAIVVGIALFWLMLWQLWSEAKGSGASIRYFTTATVDAPADVPTTPTRSTADGEVFIIQEKPAADR
ncbi:MFS transporter permease [Microbacterium sp. LTA6]|uniref:MFS transporter permease n=1 Tax=unclassified Microbacterium TaxID=2609290 RepID=UPI003139D18D